jgi:acyl-CoA thioesterase-1
VQADEDRDGRSDLRVLVLGNSIAAGSGVSPQEAFPTRLQQKVDSLGWDVTIQNAGVSGETTAGGLRRIGWLLNKKVDILLLELGGNDGLRGVDLSTTRDNLTTIIDTTLTTSPEARVLLAGMQIPPNLGPNYTDRFRELYPTIAGRYDRVTLIPFLLKNVADVDSLMQDDGIHPTAAGHRRVANTVWTYLRPMLETLRSRPQTAER